MKHIYIVVFFGLILNCPVMAESFKYQSGMSVELGGTWNPLAPNDIGGLGQCINSKASGEKPIITETYSEGFVESYEQLSNKSSISYSASGSARFGIAKASASAAYDNLRESFKDKRNIVYVVTGRRTYSPVRIMGAALSEQGKKELDQAIANNNSSSFYKACGTALITSVTKETAVSLVYIFTTSSAETRERVKTAISVAASYGSGKVSGNSSIMAEIAKVDQNTQVNLEVVQSGALDKSDTVRDLVGVQPGAISEIREGLRKAIAGITWDSSAIVAFSAERLDKHFDIPKGSDWEYAAQAYSRIDSMRDTANRLVWRYLQLKDVLADADLGYITLKDGAREKITAEMRNVDDSTEILVAAARECLDGKEGKCNTPYLDVSRKVLQFMNISYGQFGQWHGKSPEHRYDAPIEKVVAKVQFWPEFVIQNPKYIRTIDLLRESDIVVHLDNAQLSLAIVNGRLSMSPWFTAQYDNQWYCWRGRWGQDCNPWAADVQRHFNALKTKDNFTYRLMVTDVEGGKTAIAVPALRSAVIIEN